MSVGIDDNQEPQVPISGDNLDPQVAQAAGIPDDNAEPAAGYGSAGQAAAPEAGQQGTDTLGAIEQAGQEPAGSAIAKFPGNVRKIASLLMGAEAAPPQVLEQAKQGVDPGNTQPAGNQNLLSLLAVYQKEGLGGAMRMLQGNRVAFDPKQAFAYTALTGSPQKPPDLDASIHAANAAEQHVLDGSNVVFSRSGGDNITAKVTMAGTNQTQTIPLTRPQFEDYLNIKGAGQWDRLMQKTVPATLLQLSKSEAAGGGTGNPGAPAEGDNSDSKGASLPPVQPEKNGNIYNGGRDELGRSTNSDPIARQYEDSTGPVRTKFDPKTDDELLYRANRIFPPNIMGNQAAREQWIAAQQDAQAKRENELAIAKERGISSQKVAETIAGGRVQAADVAGTHNENRSTISADAKRDVAKTLSDVQRQRIDQQLAREERINQNAHERNAVSLLRQKIAGQITDPLTPGENAKVEKVLDSLNIDTNTPKVAPAVPTGRAQPPPTGAAQRPPGIPAGAKQYQGRWYTRGPNGESVPLQ